MNHFSAKILSGFIVLVGLSASRGAAASPMHDACVASHFSNAASLYEGSRAAAAAQAASATLSRHLAQVNSLSKSLDPGMFWQAEYLKDASAKEFASKLKNSPSALYARLRDFRISLAKTDDTVDFELKKDGVIAVKVCKKDVVFEGAFCTLGRSAIPSEAWVIRAIFDADPAAICVKDSAAVDVSQCTILAIGGNSSKVEGSTLGSALSQNSIRSNCSEASCRYEISTQRFDGIDIGLYPTAPDYANASAAKACAKFAEARVEEPLSSDRFVNNRAELLNDSSPGISAMVSTSAR